ncbi:MAG: DUF2189 domain-containing protein, partial [Rhodospirillales bacterium]|nr:DUF2189 domain-containing protein [Rhodospirillales bacterium]
MNQLASDVGAFSAPVRIIGTERSWQWLRAGWRDMKKAPLISLTCGAIPVVLGYFLMFGLDRAGMGYLIIPLTAGFFLAGPLIAVGFYEMSRIIAQGETPTLWRVLGAWRRNFTQLVLLGLIVSLFMLVWLLSAAILFALFMGGEAISMERDVVRQILATDASIPFLLIGTLTGVVLAVVAFTFTAISFPMLL